MLLSATPSHLRTRVSTHKGQHTVPGGLTARRCTTRQVTIGQVQGPSNHRRTTSSATPNTPDPRPNMSLATSAGHCTQRTAAH
jgi:hypothetical protein